MAPVPQFVGFSFIINTIFKWFFAVVCWADIYSKDIPNPTLVFHVLNFWAFLVIIMNLIGMFAVYNLAILGQAFSRSSSRSLRDGRRTTSADVTQHIKQNAVRRFA